MSLAEKGLKVARLLRRPHFARAALRHRVAARTEHVEAIRFCRPATLIDIGANKGQFSTAVRGLFPKAKIHAFEPLPSAADTFARVFRGDSRAHLHRVAVGEREERRHFYVADRDDSSSLLKPGEGQRAAYDVGLAREIEVEVKPLDALLDLGRLVAPVMIKIDVQGAELEVLKGIGGLDWADFIYVELSFVELYEGQPLFEEVRAHLAERGFRLAGVFNQSITAAFGPTQADFLFRRER